MYESNPDMARLRQGDVISVLNLPRFKVSSASLLHQMQFDGTLLFQKRAVIDIIPSYAVILSQCCEFNSGKRTAFSLSSMLSIKNLRSLKPKIWGINIAELTSLISSPFRGRTGVETGQIELLRAANTIREDSDKNEALNVFLYEPDGCHLQDHYIADFSRVTSLSVKDMPMIMRNKILQLDNEHRRMFQIKLAYFYARRAE